MSATATTVTVTLTAPLTEAQLTQARQLSRCLISGNEAAVRYDLARFGLEATGVTTTKTELGYNGCVLRLDTRCERIMSDVWEDVTRPVIWTGEKVEELNWTGYRGYGKPGTDADGFLLGYRAQSVPGCEYPGYPTAGDTVLIEHQVDWTVDATDEIKAKAAEWYAEKTAKDSAKTNADKLRKLIENEVVKATEIIRDADAVVVKGRKVKKGVNVRVTWVADGQYGPYANVVVADTGEQVKFVSIDNLKATDRLDWYFKSATCGFEFGAEIRALLIEYVRGNCEWGVVCDRFREADTGAWGGDRFAEALGEKEPTIAGR